MFYKSAPPEHGTNLAYLKCVRYKTLEYFEKRECEFYLIGLGVNLGSSNMYVRHPERICPAFQKQQSIIKEIVKKINKVEGLSEKAGLAKKLQKEVNVLLYCPDYAANKTNCQNCHFIAQIRKKTAALIIKVKTFEKKGRPRHA